jgi:signal transduction histidine kinase
MKTAGRVDGRVSLGRVGLPVLAIAYGAASASLALDGDVVVTAYADVSSAAAAADLAAGLGLLLAGSLAWVERVGGSLGPLTILLGIVWFAPDWVGWEEGPALVRSLGMLAAPFLLPLLAHLVLAFPTGRLGARRLGLVAVVYAGAALFSLGRALFRDPFLDLHCWSNCTDNVFLVRAEPGLVDALDTLWLSFTVVAGVLLAATCLWRLGSASRPARAGAWAVLVPAALAAGAEAADAIALLQDPEDPTSAAFRAIFFARAVAFACLAAGVAWTVIRARRARSAIARLAADLGEAPAPGSLQAALAGSLGDETLEVAYWLPRSQRYVDAAGRPLEPLAADGRAATTIVRGGQPVALVLHDSALSGAAMERELGAATRLAVDNERLRAEVVSQIEDLRASRARIVEAGDATRRRLERDLHDGAQQRLLALSYDLRIARAAAEKDGDLVDARLLAEAAGEAQAALEELRELAHGIHPAILTEAGLGPALATLADAAGLPVEIGEIPAERFPAPVETAVYVVVAEAIADAARRSAGFASVSVTSDDGLLFVEVADDGAKRISALTHVADRVGARGGRLEAANGIVRAQIPAGRVDPVPHG